MISFSRPIQLKNSNYFQFSVHVLFSMIYYFFQYVNSLEDKLKEAALKNLALLKENDRLKQRITKLEKEVRHGKYPCSVDSLE